MIVELRDANAAIRFAKAILNKEQTCQAMSRLGDIHCEITVSGLENVGKYYQHDQIEFEMPKVSYGDKVVAGEEATKHCPEGWIPSMLFSSQGSFFIRDGKPWARCFIYRWVEMPVT